MDILLSQADPLKALAGKGKTSGPFIVLSGPFKTVFMGKGQASGPFKTSLVGKVKQVDLLTQCSRGKVKQADLLYCLEWTL